jgi:transcriptional regulator with XRE-family HTH domain
MDIRKEIGARIKKARELQGWSLTELSRRTDNVLGASRISNYEQGTRLPKPREIKILARVLGTEPAHLMCLEGEEMTNEERQLLTSWRALPEKDRMAYLRRITALSMVYRDSVPDEKLQHLAAPTAKARKRKALKSKPSP